jgi:hypothetical protein
MPKRFYPRLLDRFAPRESLVLMAMAITVGAGTGLAAVFFIRLIAAIQEFSFTFPEHLIPSLGRGWLVVIPALGATVSGLVIAFVAREAKGHGVPEVMQALILRGGRIHPKVVLAKFVASAFCIGSGGSAGREGPIVQVGAALGSSVGQWLHLSDERIKNLVACGAAAGIAATFNAPIAGVVFATGLPGNGGRRGPLWHGHAAGYGARPAEDQRLAGKQSHHQGAARRGRGHPAAGNGFPGRADMGGHPQDGAPRPGPLARGFPPRPW